MKHKILIIFLIFITVKLNAQFDCTSIKFESITDTILMNGEPAVKLILSTDKNTFETGYTSFIIINNSNDTIVDYSQKPNYLMPTTPDYEIREYILNLKAPFQSIGSNFKGKIITFNPECIFDTGELTNVAAINNEVDLSVFPNPFNDGIKIIVNIEKLNFQIYDTFGRLVYQNEVKMDEYISLNHLDNGLYFIKSGNQFKTIVKK